MAVITFNLAVPIQVNKMQELRSPVLRVWSSAGCYVHRMRFRGLKQRQPRCGGDLTQTSQRKYYLPPVYISSC
jgi:hypothetical protein